MRRWVARPEQRQFNPATLQRLQPLQHLEQLCVRLSESWDDGCYMHVLDCHAVGEATCKLPDAWRAAVTALQACVHGCQASCAGCPYVRGLVELESHCAA